MREGICETNVSNKKQSNMENINSNILWLDVYRQYYPEI